MKLLICTDIEGVAGVVSAATQITADGCYYDAAKKLLTAEVNAAVEGALTAGADEILVFDGHGSGAIHFESLHPEVQLIHGRPLIPFVQLLKLLSDCDATIMIGQHAMAGVADGNLNHTQSSASIDYYKLNGQKIGEIAQWSLATGAYEIPMLFLAGDKAACAEAEALIPGVKTAAVKTGLGRHCAISLSPARAAAMIKAGVETALRQHQQEPVNPLKLKAPFILEKRFFHTETVDSILNDPRYKKIDNQTVQISGNNILDVIYS